MFQTSLLESVLVYEIATIAIFTFLTTTLSILLYFHFFCKLSDGEEMVLQELANRNSSKTWSEMKITTFHFETYEDEFIGSLNLDIDSQGLMTNAPIVDSPSAITPNEVRA
ncbi:unnamed protein product [Caenorhabditis bovis]|uniref:Uncharacterized protein n=1 Tax=Caenorhabditis bovis TaxID=2654633 RepID=A0A8S1F001_9PELO|nr:unnamed protein product [Caenorhabditis bovis]